MASDALLRILCIIPFFPQDPNARNCHGYRKFVKRTLLEDPTKGYLVNDTIIIKYTIELVVSTGVSKGKKKFTLTVI